MTIAEHKLSLIRQIDQLPEDALLELDRIIMKWHKPKKTIPKRQFGCMKGLVVLMSDDFNTPLADFNEYIL